jgi:hypothetical protein
MLQAMHSYNIIERWKLCIQSCELPKNNLHAYIKIRYRMAKNLCLWTPACDSLLNTDTKISIDKFLRNITFVKIIIKAPYTVLSACVFCKDFAMVNIFSTCIFISMSTTEYILESVGAKLDVTMLSHCFKL